MRETAVATRKQESYLIDALDIVISASNSIPKSDRQFKMGTRKTTRNISKNTGNENSTKVMFLISRPKVGLIRNSSKSTILLIVSEIVLQLLRVSFLGPNGLDTAKKN